MLLIAPRSTSCTFPRCHRHTGHCDTGLDGGHEALAKLPTWHCWRLGAHPPAAVCRSVRCHTVIYGLGAYSGSWHESPDSQRLPWTINGRLHPATHFCKVFLATAVALSLVHDVPDLCLHESGLQRRKLQRMEPPNGQPIGTMTTPSMKPPRADRDSLARQLTQLRDALVELELALRDYQFTLHSTERRSAEREACEWIGLAQASAKRAV